MALTTALTLAPIGVSIFKEIAPLLGKDRKTLIRVAGVMAKATEEELKGLGGLLDQFIDSGQTPSLEVLHLLRYHVRRIEAQADGMGNVLLPGEDDGPSLG
jgi:hypothetical protein